MLLTKSAVVLFLSFWLLFDDNMWEGSIVRRSVANKRMYAARRGYEVHAFHRTTPRK